MCPTVDTPTDPELMRDLLYIDLARSRDEISKEFADEMRREAMQRAEARQGARHE